MLLVPLVRVLVLSGSWVTRCTALAAPAVRPGSSSEEGCVAKEGPRLMFMWGDRGGSVVPVVAVPAAEP